MLSGSSIFFVASVEAKRGSLLIPEKCLSPVSVLARPALSFCEKQMEDKIINKQLNMVNRAKNADVLIGFGFLIYQFPNQSRKRKNDVVVKCNVFQFQQCLKVETPGSFTRIKLRSVLFKLFG